MMAIREQDSLNHTKQALLSALDRVRIALQCYCERVGAAPKTSDPEQAAPPEFEAPRSEHAEEPLDFICQAFGLSPFERDLLLLCAGVELDGRLASLCAAANGDPRQPCPTFSLALAALDDPHWSALSPARPLRRWQLVAVERGPTLTLSPLRIDERILHELAGVPSLDRRLVGLVEPAGPLPPLAPAQLVLAERLGEAWRDPGRPRPLPLIRLYGADAVTRRAVATAISGAAGLGLYVAHASQLPTRAPELEAIARLWEREASLTGSALLIECDGPDETASGKLPAFIGLAEQIRGVVILGGEQRPGPGQRAAVTAEIPRPTPDEQRALWRAALGPAAERLNGQLDRVVGHFMLGAPEIAAVGAVARGALQRDGEIGLGAQLWDACRAHAAQQLDDLAQHIHAAAGWDDLVLPEAQLRTLHNIAAHVRQRTTVYERWGFAARGERGLGLVALFAGPSGTGKTTAAEAIARELRLDLYRIDLSAVVSKYVGETEKHLRRVFDAAEAAGAILLFDEADALFGKRSEVRDSHDRFANIEVSYLLQRVETYRGLAILTTNMRQALDQAFLRRIRFVVQFPFPDAGQRAAIWRRVFPPATPTEGLEVLRLAQLNIAGGSIRNIALGAAFLAADAGEAVTMGHVLQAARDEYAKLDRTLTAAETAGWKERADG